MLKEKDWYIEKITKIISKIDSVVVLSFLYNFIKNHNSINKNSEVSKNG